MPLSSAFCTDRMHSVFLAMTRGKDLVPMIRSHLSRLMGEKRVRIADVARETGIGRNMIARLYYERARRIDLNDLDKLCSYFSCSVADLLEWRPDQPATKGKPAVSPDALTRSQRKG